MSASLLPFPPAEEAERLHARLCAGADATASADLCQAYLAPLLAWLRCRYRGCDPHLLEAAAHETLINYILKPHGFDPCRRSLHGYLQMSAAADLANLLRQEKRHQRHRIDLQAVEVEPVREDLLVGPGLSTGSRGGTAGGPGPPVLGCRETAGRGAGAAGADGIGRQ